VALAIWLCRAGPPTTTGHVTVPVSRTVGLAALAVFFLLLAGLPILLGLLNTQGVALFEALYRSGALVIWRWPCGAAVAARSLCDTRLGQR